MEALASGALQFHDGTAARRIVVDNFTGNITVTGDLSVTGQATVDNLNLNGNTISSTNVDGGIIIDPNGNGNIDLTVSGSGVINLGSASITISPSGVMTVTGQLNADNIRIDGNTISSTDTNGDIILDPNGTGNVKVDSLTASLPVKTDASKNLVSGAISLTSEVSGILPVANGGTGSSSQNFVDLTTNQSIDGTKTLLDPIVIDPVANQIVLGNTNTTTISSTAPSASRVVTLPDAGANSNIVLSEGAKTINGNTVFGDDLQILKDLQLKIGTDNAATGNIDALSVADSSVFRFTNNTAPTIRGVAGGAEAKFAILTNAGTGTLSVSNENVAATAANRIITGTAADLSVAAGASIWLYYDSSASRWRVIGGSGGSAGAGSMNIATARTNGAGTEINCSVSVVSSKTRVVVSSMTLTANAFDVYLDGKRVPLFTDSTLTPDASYTLVNSTTIDLDQDYSGSGLQIEIIARNNITDTSTTNAALIAELQTAQAQLEPFVINSMIAVPNTQIIGRAQVRNDAATCDVICGVERIQVEQIAQMQSEFGPNGERVFKSVSDLSDRIRLVGNWAQEIDSYGTKQRSDAQTTNYIEVTFYGTGLNIICLLDGTARPVAVSIDGGSETVFLNSTFSGVLNNRNYSPNSVSNLVSGLTLGQHTIKIRQNGSALLYINGFEILNERTNIRALPGTAISAGRILALSSNTDTAFNASFDQIERDGAVVGSIGTRGARVVHYIDSTGAAKKRAYATNSAQANLTSADHTNESVIRVYHPREFGANRADDFSTLTNATSPSNRAFTLEDGTTSLVGNSVGFLTGDYTGQPDTLYVDPNNSAFFLTFTFVGTGIDLFQTRPSGTSTYNVILDGTTIATGVSVNSLGIANKVWKIASGLPYGTHTLRIQTNTLVSASIGFSQFIVYGPKKPSLPANVSEQADYYLTADYSVAASATNQTVSQGVLQKATNREMVLSGSWSAVSLNTTLYRNGQQVNVASNGAYLEYTFFGTGLDIRGQFSVDSTFNVVVSIDGSTNLSGYTTSLVTASTATFTAATGVLSASSPAANPYLVRISGIAAGMHKVRILCNNGTTNLTLDALDIHTPIHSPIASLFDQQNTSPVGSCSLADTRKFSPVQSLQPAQKYRGVAVGVTSGPTTTSTSYVPCPEMSLTVPSKGGWFELNLTGDFANSSVPQRVLLSFYLNGNAIGRTATPIVTSANDAVTIAMSSMVYLPAGVHKIDAYWSVVVGTALARLTSRELTVKEL